MKANEKEIEEMTTVSIRTPLDLHVMVMRRMLDETGKTNFTKLILDFFRHYATSDEVAIHPSTLPPQSSTFSNSTDRQQPTPYDLLLQIDQEAAGHLDVLMTCLVERARERQRLESTLSTATEDIHKVSAPGKKRRA